MRLLGRGLLERIENPAAYAARQVHLAIGVHFRADIFVDSGAWDEMRLLRTRAANHHKKASLPFHIDRRAIADHNG